MRYDTIPAELKLLPQWVNSWNNSKIPMHSTIKKSASSVDPNTWNTYETAVASVEDGNYDHIGFVFANNGIVGIDIDAGFEDNGLLSALSVDLIRHCESYTEKSKSGRGIHILVKGDLPFNGRNNRNGVEIYKSGRYFIMTGKTLIFKEIIENQAAIDYIVSTYFPETVESNDSNRSPNIYQPVFNEPKDGKISLRPTYPPIPDGCRNISLTSLAGQLHNAGYNYEQIYDELCYANEVACKPPLDEYEILTIVNSITKYRR